MQYRFAMMICAAMVMLSQQAQADHRAKMEDVLAADPRVIAIVRPREAEKPTTLEPQLVNSGFVLGSVASPERMYSGSRIIAPEDMPNPRILSPGAEFRGGEVHNVGTLEDARVGMQIQDKKDPEDVKHGGTLPLSVENTAENNGKDVTGKVMRGDTAVADEGKSIEDKDEDVKTMEKRGIFRSSRKGRKGRKGRKHRNFRRTFTAMTIKPEMLKDEHVKDEHVKDEYVKDEYMKEEPMHQNVWSRPMIRFVERPRVKECIRSIFGKQDTMTEGDYPVRTGCTRDILTMLRERLRDFQNTERSTCTMC